MAPTWIYESQVRMYKRVRPGQGTPALMGYGSSRKFIFWTYFAVFLNTWPFYKVFGSQNLALKSFECVKLLTREIWINFQTKCKKN